MQHDIEDLPPVKKLPGGVMACVADLKEEEKALPAYALRGKLHRLACEQGLEGYTDPVNGEVVPSKGFLEKRECCGDRCRHCPHNFVNVPKVGESSEEEEVALEFPPPTPLAKPPLTLADAFNKEDVKNAPPYALRGKLHRAACDRNHEAYVDPSRPSAAVYTVDYLRSLGECCGQRCSHCPYGYKNCKLPSETSTDSDQ